MALANDTTGGFLATRWRRTESFRSRLDRSFPRLARRLPEGVVNGFDYVYRTWQLLSQFYLTYLIAAGVMIIIPSLMQNGLVPYLSGSYGVTVLFNTGYWILLTLGLSVVVGLAGLLDLGYVAFFMIGAYITALMTASGSPDQFHIVEWPVWASIPFAILAAMIAGFTLGIPTLRLRGDYLAIVTLGFHEIVRQSINNLDILNGSRGIAGIPTPSIGDYQFGLDAEKYWWFLLIPAILIAVIMIRHLDNSRVGRYWSAIREDEVAAAAMGVPVTKMKVLAFVIGASTSGLAGWIYAVKVTYVAPNSFLLLLSILVLCSVVIGGLGSISGAVLGGVLVMMLPEIVRSASDGRAVFGFDIETGRIAVFGVLLIVVMIYRPGGLLAARRRRTELSDTVSSEAVVEETEEPAITRNADRQDERKDG
ncbi:MAG TPA: branched-chain amino acid ABC transporter permease [Actinomycetota bacterium]|nr:branched-chain amino acid ABC transporter permease [Actinomycetota bacterium]